MAVPLKTQGGKFQRLDAAIQRCHAVCDFSLLILDDEIRLPEIQQAGQIKTLYISALHNRKSAISIPEPCVLQPDDMALIQFSSGSTGHPKGVIVTHGMMMAQLKNLEIQATRPLADHRVTCYASWAPINHDMGLFMGVLSPVYHGAHNILVPPAYYVRNPMRWFELMAKHQVQVAMFTNSVLAKSLPVLGRKLAQQALDLSQCHLYLGAEKVSARVVEAAYQVLGPYFGGEKNLYIGYGMAENGLGVTTTFPGKLTMIQAQIAADGEVTVLTPGSTQGNTFVAVGYPYPHNEVTINDAQGSRLPERVLGEIYIQSNSLTPGYFNNKAQTERVLSNGCFKSGDLGFFHDGQLYFHSRKDDLIILGGQNIVPDDIEQVVEELAFIRPSSTTLFATEAEQNGLQQLYLLVESNHTLSAEVARSRKNAIINHVFVELGVMLNGVYLCTKGTIEKTSSGKKRRKVIKQRFMDNQVQLVSADE